MPPARPLPEPTRMNLKPSTMDAVTPQRQASLKLVDRGKALIDSKEYERAAASFRDAINLDARNGVAYYYLAMADAKLGQFEVALGLLEKAEALLGADEEWMGRIDELRLDIGAPVSKPVVPSPIDQAF